MAFFKKALKLIFGCFHSYFKDFVLILQKTEFLCLCCIVLLTYYCTTIIKCLNFSYGTCILHSIRSISSLFSLRSFTSSPSTWWCMINKVYRYIIPWHCTCIVHSSEKNSVGAIFVLQISIIKFGKVIQYL